MKELTHIRRIWIAGLLVVVVLWPLPALYLFSARDRYYDNLLAAHECYPLSRCHVDLNNDGVSGQLQLIENSQFSAEEKFLAVVEGGSELLRIPYILLDDTLRTHIAVTHEAAGNKLVVFQPGGRDQPPTNTVYVWNQGSAEQIRPSETDEELLRAMAARDGSGTWPQWALFRFLKFPALFFYYALSAIGIALVAITRRRQRQARVHPPN